MYHEPLCVYFVHADVTSIAIDSVTKAGLCSVGRTIGHGVLAGKPTKSRGSSLIVLGHCSKANGSNFSTTAAHMERIVGGMEREVKGKSEWRC